jgi:hypothetical protein
MLIGIERLFDSEPNSEITGHWFESSTGSHFMYTWEVDERSVAFWLGERGSDAAFRGAFHDGGSTIKGEWRWTGGGYELTMTRR